VSVSDLPHLNALLNGTAAVFLAAGWVFIKRRHVTAHRRCMITAFVVSGLFLTSYVVYHAQAGSRPYEGVGLLRTVYFAILIPHVVLAAAVLPMAIITLRRGLRRDDSRHRRIARWTLPIWLFVSVSGVVVYLMLYY
jgi:putative membrane protein